MSQFSGTPDFLYSVGADTTSMDRTLEKSAKKTESAFGQVGTRIEKSTEGARKFSGALSSTVGIATGLLGVIGFAVGAATALYAVWDNIANATERAEANARAQAGEVRKMASELRGMGGDSRGLFSVNEDVLAIQDRARAIRMQLQNSGAGGATLFDQLAEIDRAEQQAINRVYFERSAQLTDIVNSTRMQIEMDQLRRNGMTEEAEALQRETEYRERINSLTIAQQNAVNNKFQAQSQQLLELIDLEHERFKAAEQYFEQQQRIAEDQKRMSDFRMAGDFAFDLEQQLLRISGKDQLADLRKINKETGDLLDRLQQLEGVSPFERMGLEQMIFDLAQLRRDQLLEPTEDPSGIRFGSSVGGAVGTTAAAQVLGGTANITQQLDRQRNTTLASMDRSLKELVRNSNAGGTGTAVFS